ncbi:LA_2486 family SGNH/GDSL-type esterase [Leptospira perdikensis]|uniref:LA_2486 family SGNH/GDSL-type esterase n=1 Tax=Leptospira perdikensis TaxID=2484948 RepID=UPI001ABFBD75
MKKSFKILFYLTITLLLSLSLGEVFFRFQNGTDTEEIRYKKFHCLYGFDLIRLCSNRKETFTRVDGKTWDIQTNSIGERILSEETNPKDLWLVGDSMAMGYGLPTNETPASYLKSKYKLEVRVIAVDAIGTNGILNLLKEAFTSTNSKDQPKQIYWIWNPSDFIDDEREKKGIKKYLYPIHYHLIRNSYIYQNLLPSQKANVYTSSGIPILYPKNHITYSNLYKFLNDPTLPIEKLNILFSWGMSKVGKPDTKDPNYEEAKKFFTDQGIKPIDLRTKTEILFQEQKQVYIPGDGHPGPALAELFADAIAKDFLNLP